MGDAGMVFSNCFRACFLYFIFVLGAFAQSVNDPPDVPPQSYYWQMQGGNVSYPPLFVGSSGAEVCESWASSITHVSGAIESLSNCFSISSGAGTCNADLNQSDGQPDVPSYYGSCVLYNCPTNEVYTGNPLADYQICEPACDDPNARYDWDAEACFCPDGWAENSNGNCQQLPSCPENSTLSGFDCPCNSGYVASSGPGGALACEVEPEEPDNPEDPQDEPPDPDDPEPPEDPDDEEPPECPTGFSLDGNVCLSDDDPPEEEDPTCPTGYGLSFNNGVPTCNQLDDPDLEQPQECPEGYTQQGNLCINDQDPDDEQETSCPDGYSKDGDVCIRDSEEGTCPTGFLYNPSTKECLAEDPQCPAGKVLNSSLNVCQDPPRYDSAGCDSYPTCQGDPILCGIAGQLHQSRCWLQDPDFDSTELTQGVEQGWGPDNQVDLGESIVTTGPSGSCPSPQVVDVFDGSIEFPYTPFCELALILNPFILIVGALSALRITYSGVQV